MLIEITNKKALGLIGELEELHLIKVLKQDIGNHQQGTRKGSQEAHQSNAYRMEQFLIDTHVVSDYSSASLPASGMTFMDNVMDVIPKLSVISQIK